MPRPPSRGLSAGRDLLLSRALRESGVRAELEALRIHHAESWEHCRRVARACAELAHEFFESPAERQALALAGLVHDVGKLGIPSALLDKPSKLSAEERSLVERHATRGFERLQCLDHHPARLAVLQHHRFTDRPYPDRERLETVYQDGWAETDVRLGEELGQIIAAFDMFDALVHRRAYKEPHDPDRVELTVRSIFKGDSRFLDLVAERFRGGSENER